MIDVKERSLLQNNSFAAQAKEVYSWGGVKTGKSFYT